MSVKHLAAAAAVTAAMMVGGAYAQTGNMNSPATTTGAAHLQGDWRASKLSGVDVYNEANDKIGSVSDVILDRNGKIAAVILGVGGFLGVGEHYVSVNFDQLKWSNEPVRTSNASGAAPATNVDSTSRTAADNTSRVTTGAAGSSTRSNDKWYPDHAVLNATKEQLKAMPQFEY
ncbi:MAG: PRC-barrel domain-containing protein [Xanthobacteraceae bacterium]|nr:PRC-barrel domain-containing protein [Xanthobacteraceae bacterium]